MSDTEMPCFFSDRVAFVILNTTILKDDLASCKYKKKVWIIRQACTQHDATVHRIRPHGLQ